MYTPFIIYLILVLIIVGSLFSKKFRTLLGVLTAGSIGFALYFIICWSI